MTKIYLDYAATTPVDPKVLKAMLPFFSEKFGNGSSVHHMGQEAGEAVENSRKIAADFFHSDIKEIVFTSGATESNNLAIKGVFEAYMPLMNGYQDEKPHIITTEFEHHCVLDACKSLERRQMAEVTYLPVTKDGLIRVDDVEKSIKQNTILVSIMYVNNEIGTVQPIAKIGRLIEKINKARKDTKLAKIVFHTDATQAINYFDCDVEILGADLLSMSAHKIYGPKGIGVLYVREGTPISRVQDGGAQEFGKRAGTLNTPGIVGLGAAISAISEQETKNRNLEIERLRDYLIGKVLKDIPKTVLIGSKIKRSPNNANFSFRNVEGESLLLMLDAEGICCSTGSACSSGSLAPSHVLLAIGKKHEDAHGSLRVTIGKYTTKKEIDTFTAKLIKIVAQLRKVSGNVLGEYYQKKKN